MRRPPVALPVAVTPRAPRWAPRAAHAVPLLVLPSALFRPYVLVSGPVCDRRLSAPSGAASAALGPGESLGVAVLSVCLVAAALLTAGLVRARGGRVPRRVPVIGGRGIPVLAAVVPADPGAAFLGVATPWGLFGPRLDVTPPPQRAACVFPASGPELQLIGLTHAPPVARPPPLAVAYYRRRARPGPAAGRAVPSGS